MSESDEKRLEKLTGKLIEVIDQLNIIEKTFSRVKNESEELLRKLLKRNGNKR